MELYRGTFAFSIGNEAEYSISLFYSACIITISHFCYWAPTNKLKFNICMYYILTDFENLRINENLVRIKWKHICSLPSAMIYWSLSFLGHNEKSFNKSSLSGWQTKEFVFCCKFLKLMYHRFCLERDLRDNLRVKVQHVRV